jgi:stearoyl-CoA desaturase (delta-9 desaturase)
MLVKPRIRPGAVDTSDLKNNEVVQWQSRRIVEIGLVFGILVPMSICGYFWGDWRGGFYYAAMTRMVFNHHVSYRLTRHDSYLTRFLVHF